MFLTTELTEKAKIRPRLPSGEYLQGAGDMNLCQTEITSPREELPPKMASHLVWPALLRKEIWG